MNNIVSYFKNDQLKDLNALTIFFYDYSLLLDELKFIFKFGISNKQLFTLHLLVLDLLLLRQGRRRKNYSCEEHQNSKGSIIIVYLY